MAIRSKARRRLLLLLVIAVGGVSAAAGFYAFQKYRIQQGQLASRERGVEAFEEGRFFDAMHALGTYVINHPGDAETLYLYAQARLEVEEGDGVSHLRAGMSHLRKVVALDPANEEAKRKLLELYVTLGMAPEAMQLAETMLEAHPDDPELWMEKASAMVLAKDYRGLLDEAESILSDEGASEEQVVAAMRYRTVSLIEMERTSEAVQQAMALNERAPEDFRGYLTTLNAMEKDGRGRQERLAWAQKVQRDHPDMDGAFLLIAQVYASMNNAEAAIRMAEREAERQPREPIVVQLLIRQLSMLGRLETCVALLRDLQDRDPSLPQELLLDRYLLFSGLFDEVVERTEYHVEHPERASVRALSYRVQALFELERDDEALELVSGLERKDRSDLAMSYGSILRLLYAEEAQDPKQLIQAIDSTVRRDPGNPMLYYWRGQALSRLGESDRALEAWGRAWRLSPVWPVPALAMTRELSRTGRSQEAYQVALGHVALQPTSPVMVIDLFRMSRAVMESIPLEGRQKLLAQSERLLELMPGHEIVLPVHVQLLASVRGEDAAATYLRGVLDSGVALSPQARLQLSDLSAQLDLGLAGRLLAEAGAEEGSQQVVVGRATVLMREGKTDEALAVLDEAITEAGSEVEASALSRMRAALLDRFGDGRALEAWRALLDESEEDSALVQQALSMSAVWQDEAYAEELVARLNRLLGDESQVWRTQRARWLLRYGDQDDLVEAGDLLEEVVESSPAQVPPRLMLAEVYHRRGETDEAIKQLEAVVARTPDARPILNLGRMYLQVDRRDDAVRLYEVLLNRVDTLEPDQLREAVQGMAAVGYAETAIEVLEPRLAEGGALDDFLLLARLYASAGRIDDARGIYDRLLDQDRDAFALLSEASRFYQQIGDRSRADEVMERMRGMDGVDPAVLLLLEGDYVRRTGDLGRARDLYSDAAEADPVNADAWARYLASLVLTGEPDRAVEVMDTMIERLPESDLTTELRENRALIVRGLADPGMQSLIVQAIEQPHWRSPAISILRAAYSIDPARKLDSPSARREIFDDVAVQLRAVVRDHEAYLPGHLVLIRTLTEAGRVDEALTVALQAVRRFPDQPEAVALATDLLMRQRQWVQAQNMARQWRALLPAGNRLIADLNLAQSLLALGSNREAVQLLEPYVEVAMSRPEELSTPLARWSVGKIRIGEHEDVRTRLRPLMEQDVPGWRLTWLQLAGDVVPAKQDALAWMNDLVSELDPDVEGERLQMALGWQKLGQRFGDDQLRTRARALLEEGDWAQRSSRIMLNLAIMDDTEGDNRSAEARYRAVLDQEPENTFALNNLAMLLHHEGENEEAETFARKAVELAPSALTFWDTLATVLMGAERYEEALAAIDSVVALDPETPSWRLTRVQVLIAMGRVGEAGRNLSDLDRQVRSEQSPDPALLERISELHEALRQATEANAAVTVP